MLLLLHLDDDVSWLLPRLVVALPVEDFSENHDYDSDFRSISLTVNTNVGFFILEYFSCSCFISNPCLPEVTWAAFVQLDLDHLLLLRRLLTLATLAPVISTGRIFQCTDVADDNTDTDNDDDNADDGSDTDLLLGGMISPLPSHSPHTAWLCCTIPGPI